MQSPLELSKKRDELNASVKGLIDSVRGKMAELKSLDESAKKLKEERDSKNKIAVDFKKKRDALNAEAKKLSEELKKINAELEKIPSGDKPLGNLKKQREELDWKIQTEHHSVKQDEALRDKLEEIESALASGEKGSTFYAKRHELHSKLAKVREEAEMLHSLVVDNSQSAKKLHEELISAYGKIKAIREEVSPVSKKIRDLKKEANDVHGEIIAARRGAHENAQAERNAKMSALEEGLRMRAKELLKEFSGGKKLSTEELQIIQRYG